MQIALGVALVLAAIVLGAACHPPIVGVMSGLYSVYYISLSGLLWGAVAVVAPQLGRKGNGVVVDVLGLLIVLASVSLSLAFVLVAVIIGTAPIIASLVLVDIGMVLTVLGLIRLG
jgi:hypothetical protein